jgi:hypothetical protein
MRLPSLFILALVLSLAQSTTVQADEVESNEEYIVGGQRVLPEDVRATVAVLRARDGEGPNDLMPSTIARRVRCSGVLIAPSVVVTAAHCVDACDVCGDWNEGFYLCEPCEAHPRSTREFYVAAGFRTLDEVWQAEVVPVRDIFMHEAYRSFPDWNFDYSSCEVDDEGHLHCQELVLAAKPHDVAVLLLEAPVRGLAPVTLPRLDDMAELTTGLAQGYGLRGAALRGG